MPAPNSAASSTSSGSHPAPEQETPRNTSSSRCRPQHPPAPPAAYPLLAETAQHARGIPPDQEFRQGLDIVLDGLRAMLPDSA
jgi:hypothetical protein